MQAGRASNSGSGGDAGAELASLVHKHISRERKRREKEKKKKKKLRVGFVFVLFGLVFFKL